MVFFFLLFLQHRIEGKTKKKNRGVVYTMGGVHWQGAYLSDKRSVKARRKNEEKKKKRLFRCVVSTIASVTTTTKKIMFPIGKGVTLFPLTTPYDVGTVQLLPEVVNRKVKCEGKKDGEKKKKKDACLKIQQPAREQCTFGTMTGCRPGVDPPTMQSYIHFVVYIRYVLLPLLIR